MKKIYIILLTLVMLNFVPAVCASDTKSNAVNYKKEERLIKSVLKSQVRYANRTNFDKFIATYDKSYKNADGFDYETYSKMVRELWETYNKIKYGIEITDIKTNGNDAEVHLIETSYADIKAAKHMDGILTSRSNSIYYLKKFDNKWKVVADKVIDETTSMLYGEAKKLDIKLTAPLAVTPKTEYTASLEFIPPEDSFAIASIAQDKVEYPQKKAKEVYRKMPEDNILERLFIANSDNLNEYIVASIGITKANIENLSIQLSLTGFGYQIIRVNVIPESKEGTDVKNR